MAEYTSEHTGAEIDAGLNDIQKLILNGTSLGNANTPIYLLDGSIYQGSACALASHNHDSAYSAISHNHDDRYYTESEINSLLENKIKIKTITPSGCACSWTYYNGGHGGGYFTIEASVMEGLMGISNYTAINYYWINFSAGSCDLFDPIPGGSYSSHRVWIRQMNAYSSSNSSTTFPYTYPMCVVYI